MDKINSLGKKIIHSRKSFWIVVLCIWLIATFVDRCWWSFFSNTPSWDQADYLNSAIDHLRALSFVDGYKGDGLKSLLDLSPKIPPLASIVNGFVIALVGDSPHLAAWSLSLWNGFLIFNIASWALYLKGSRYSLISVLITSITPFIFNLRTDYVLELPLISATTFYLFHLGRWSDPFSGGKWVQMLIATFACSASLLIKQSSLLVIIPSFLFIIVISIKRSNLFRLQFICLLSFSFLSILPWFYHNWIMILSGTHRAVFESASLEGDPSIFEFNSIFWYFPLLKSQFGSFILSVGLSGLLLKVFGYIRFLKVQKSIKNTINNSYKWIWLYFNLIASWTFTTFIPNKDPRYIACSIPLIILLFALGFCNWSEWIDFKFKFNSYGLFFFIPLSFLLCLPVFKYRNSDEQIRKYYPINEIISEVKLNSSKDEKHTIIVVPSTPKVNQHNVTYIGRMGGWNILGRQLGQSLVHKKFVLEQAKWIILAEGDQGSVRKNSLVLDKTIRKSGFFNQIEDFPRKSGGTFSLWKRNSTAPLPTRFHERFVELAKGMGNGPKGVEMIFEEIAIQHMIDGHFKYQNIVRDEALSKIELNPKDIDALWTLSLLNILLNRPYEADTHLKSLEQFLPHNPWPSAYRSIVNLASWNPWRASQIADSANEIHDNYLLKALGDTAAVIGGKLWRLPSAFKSLPFAIEKIEKI